MPVPTPTSRMRPPDRRPLGGGDRGACGRARTPCRTPGRRSAPSAHRHSRSLAVSSSPAIAAATYCGDMRAAAGRDARAVGHARPALRDEAAAEHARLALARVVEHAGLPGRNAVLAVDQLDLVAAARRRSHAACGGRVERTFTKTSRRSSASASSSAPSPIQLTSRSAMRLRAQRLARADDDAARARHRAARHKAARRPAMPRPAAGRR